MLEGNKVEQLKTISLDKDDNHIFNPVLTTEPHGFLVQLSFLKTMVLFVLLLKLELHPDFRYLTVFHASDEFYQYKRLIMGAKPAQGELNAALTPLFAHIPNVYLIHDDRIIAGKIFNEYNLAIQEIMKAIDKANLKLNPKKCSFGKTEIAFCEMTFSSSGVMRGSEKVKALENLPPPKNKIQLKSLTYMMQSNSDFIPSF